MYAGILFLALKDTNGGNISEQVWKVGVGDRPVSVSKVTPSSWRPLVRDVRESFQMSLGTHELLVFLLPKCVYSLGKYEMHCNIFVLNRIFPLSLS